MKEIVRKWLAGILSVVMVFSLLPVMASAEDTPFLNDGGSGTDGDPYRIATKEQLAAFRDYINNDSGHGKNQFFKLTQDIDLGGQEWTPIGTAGSGPYNPFKGTFDGGGFTVSGLYIYQSDGEDLRLGLFGYIGTGGTVKNLGVSGSIDGNESILSTVGGIAGQNEGTIENCHNAAAVTGSLVGGIVGQLGYEGSVYKCYNTGNIGNIERCTDAGGIAGSTTNSNVADCYNTGMVSGNMAGGIVGMASEGRFTSCYNTGHVEGEGTYGTGGLAGYGNINQFTNCYYLDSTAPHDFPPEESSNGSRKTADEFRSLASLLNNGGDGTTWVNDPLLGRPVLESNRETAIATADHPFQIPDKETLENFREYVNAGNDCTGMYFELTDDINLEGSGENPWTPIGWSERDDKHFNGTFDGGHHIVSGLYVSGGTPDYWRGLFGHIGESGTVRDLIVEGEVSGSMYIGGIAGQCEGSIDNCVNNATVTGSMLAGGIVGDVGGNASVKDCENIGKVTGDAVFIGGIVGKISGDVTISGCANSGEVSGINNIGGVAGGAEDSSTAAIVATVKNCHNFGKVTGKGNNIGGVVGMIDSKCTVVDCHSSGEVSGGQNTGGVVGFNDRGKVKNCYNTGAISGMVYIGGVVGSNGGTTENCYNVGTVEGEMHNTGGVAGSNSGTMTSCYNTGKVYGPDSTGGVVGIQSVGSCTDCCYLEGTAENGVGDGDAVGVTKKSSAEFRFLASALGEGWADSVEGRPVLLSNQEASTVSADTPYEIPDAETLKAFRDYINGSSDGGAGKVFRLTADIDLLGSDSDQWTPIGSGSDQFNGTFDGGSFTVSGLKITSGSLCGLFGIIGESGTVQNLTVEGEFAGTNGGGVAGISFGIIENCQNNVKITNNGYAGGIAGLNNGTGTVRNCRNSGEVTGRQIGGIVGNNMGPVDNCYNSGAVTASDSTPVGGIVGTNSDDGVVKNCYNTGTVTASGSAPAGGIVGYNTGSAAENCYYLDTSCGTAGGGTAKTSAEFASGEVAYLLQNGQDTPDTQVWGQTVGSGYPELTSDPSEKVYKVTFATFDDSDYAAGYANYNGTVTLPADPEVTGMAFDHWSKDNSISGEKFDETTLVTDDITVYAVGRKRFAGDEVIEVSLVYGYTDGTEVDLDTHMHFEDGTDVDTEFTYALTDKDEVTGASVDENILTIPTGLGAGAYILTVTASKAPPELSLISVGPYGTDPVTLTVKVTVAKADPVVTPPTGNTLTYTGAEQELVKQGSTTGGEMQYSLDKDGVYSTSIPTGTDAGSYTVWYKVVGDENYNDVEARSVNVTIRKGNAVVTGSPVSITYGQEVTLTVNVAPKATNGISLASAAQNEVVFTFPKNGKTETRTVDAAGGTVTVTIPANEVKDYFNPYMNTVTVSYGGGDNMNGGASTTIPVIVTQKTAMFAFKATDKKYDGTTTVEGTFSAMSGSVLDGDDVSVDKYTATTDDPDVGYSKAVTVKIESLSGQDAAYYSILQSMPVTAVVTISKADNTDITPPTAENRVYDGTEQPLVSGGSSAQGEMQYALGNASYATDDYAATVPQARDAGTYYVWYKVVGDKNHNDSRPNKVEVTIEQKPVTLTWEGFEGLIYTGNPVNVTATTTDFVETDKGGGIDLSISGNTETNVGVHVARATLEGLMAGNYRLTNDKQQYIISKAIPTVVVSASEDPTYGSDITLTATVTSGAIYAANLDGTVQFKVGETPLGEGVRAENKWTLTVSGTNTELQKKLFGEGGTSTVTAEYGGNTNIESGSGEATVKVTPRPLEYDVTATGRAYDGTTVVEVALEPTNLVGDDDVTLTATGNVSSADAGTYDQITLTGVTANGGDAKYYSVEGSKSATASVTISKATVTFSVSGNAHEYTGVPQKATVTQTAPDGLKLTESSNYEVYYTAKDAADTTGGTMDGETNAGTYGVWVKLTEDTYKNYMFAGGKRELKVGELTVSTVVATCTAPTAKDLTYTGKTQQLVDAGEPVGGEMMYALGDNGETAPEIAFGTGISTGLDAGTYYVWYYVKGDANHDDSEKACVTVTIAKAPVSFTVSGNAFPYDAKAHTAKVEQNGDEVQIPDGGFAVTYGEDKAESKTDAGSYDIYVTLNNDNFKFQGEADTTREKKLDDKLTISRSAIELNVTGTAITYGQTLSASTLSGTATLSNGTAIAGNWSWDETAATTHPAVSDSGVTEYTVIFTPDAGSDNFTPGA